MKATYRQLFHLRNRMKDIGGRGTMEFRIAVAAIGSEATKYTDQFQEARKPGKGMDEYQEELDLIKKQCTEKVKDGDKEQELVNVEKYMPLLRKCKARHKKAIEESEKLLDDANKKMDTEQAIAAVPIKLADIPTDIETDVLSVLYPFLEPAQNNQPK